MYFGESALRITVPMYEKGRSFIMASGLVRAYKGHQLVYLHLLCQGFENIGKAILLAEDYEKYGPLLMKTFGHNLEKLLDELKDIYGHNFLTKSACIEIQEINKFYKQHQLRHGNNIDFSGVCTDLNVNHLHSELIAHLEFLNRKFDEIENHT